jgi:hypothetical protein
MAKNAKVAKPAKVASGEFITEDMTSSGASSYMKFEKGDSKFRIISAPISGWLEWVDKKPVRTPLTDGEPEASDDENPPKKFLAMAVIDKKDDNVKILELTQQSVIKAIRALSNNPDWGIPFTYDINVNKTGESMKTKYVVQASPKTKLSKEQMKAAAEKQCNLEALFAGEDPWKVDGADNVTEYILK